MSVQRRLTASLIAHAVALAALLLRYMPSAFFLFGDTRQECNSREDLQLRLLPDRWVQLDEVVQ